MVYRDVPPIVVAPTAPDSAAQIALLTAQLANAEDVIAQKTAALAALKTDYATAKQSSDTEIATLKQQAVAGDRTIQTLTLRHNQIRDTIIRLLAAMDAHTTTENQLRELMKVSG